MPSTRIIFFKEADGLVPVIQFLDGQANKKVKAKCIALIRLLAKFGYELKRPRSDGLRDGIRELRTEVGNVNYRLLYFFHGQNCVVISHGITKGKEVPDSEIDKAIENKELYKSDPKKYTYTESEQYYEEEDTEN
jgi:phage-related protein